MLTRMALPFYCLTLFATSMGAADAGDEKLNGAWQITALIDNGEFMPLSNVETKLIKDGRLTVKGQTISFVKPTTNDARELLFTRNDKATPKSIDLAGAEKTGSKGIYQLDGNSLILCLCGPETTSRPTDFASTKGSNAILIMLKRVDPATAPQIPVPVVPATPAATPANKDATLRNQLVGSWGFQDDDKTETITFNQDGTWSSSRVWKSGFKKIFHENVRSSGTYRVENGVVVLIITASTESSMRNQVYSYRIASINANDVIFVDQQGQAHREWRVR